MSANLDKLKAILREMFQLDQAELDFGIYRIMNQKRDDIEKFLDKDLLPQVQEAFSAYQGTDQKAVKEEMDKLRKTLEDAGVIAEDAPKFKALQEKLTQSVDVTALENEVFSHLSNFFRRYYNEGDFLSLRRYKAGVYAIPYEGEEVKLHWANADQYYIKSTENFRNYTFKLPSGKRVHFKLVEASTEQNNKKEQPGKERRFMLVADTPLVIENGELIIRFEYRICDNGAKQSVLNEKTAKTILTAASEDWKRELSVLASNDKRTLLEKHLDDYTARYLFDYFIHKDLGGFLRREMDFFIKNEVLFLDDLDPETVQKSLSKAKVIKGIGLKIIAFLEQLENFQKKLWQKKKFVVETGYCVTIDRVPEELHSAIIGNMAQVEEWKRLFAIQDIEGNLHVPKFTNPLTNEFLKANPFLVLDTAFFNRDFTERLLASFDNLDIAMNGLLVHSENFQALNLLSNGYTNQVDAIYADPPYNTSASEIIYKNSYKHSSWLSLMSDRLRQAKSLMTNKAISCTTIDDFEMQYLNMLLTDVFGEENHLATTVIRSKPQGRATAVGFSPNHEYGLFYSKSSEAVVGRLPRDEIQSARYSERDEQGIYTWANFRKTGGDSLRGNRPKSFYPVYVTENGLRITNMTWDNEKQAWEPSEEPRPDESVVLPIDDDGVERVWTLGWERAQKETAELLQREVGGRWQIYRKYRPNQDGALPGTWWDNSLYSASESGTKVLQKLFGFSGDFSYPKSLYAVIDCLRATNPPGNGTVLDFFAGSGTTGHATICLNREDEGRRKYILVEMGDYFDTILKPRIQKVIYSKDWNNGKPVSREGSSHFFKYIRLESYEDALNNLEMKRTEAQQSLLEHHDKLREEYMLSYMLDVESRESASLLNVEEFKDPFGYQMNIASGNETKVTTIDLMETFNYLLGIRVLRISAPERRTAEFERDGEGRQQLRGKPRSCAIGEGWTFREVEGTTLAGEKVLIIWRTLTGQTEEDNLMLEAYFSKRNYSTLDFEFRRIYVNGDNNLENLKIGEERWKVALIEEEFKRLMFSAEDV